MNFKLQLMACLSNEQEPVTEDIFSLNRDELTVENLGLTLAESKDLLKTIQQKLIDKQIGSYMQAHAPVDLRKKGSYPIRLKTLFGDVTVNSPRFYLPQNQDETGAKTFSPLNDILSQHVTPERLYLETKWASLIPYQKTADLLKEVLPIDQKLNATTIQHHLHAVVEEQEKQLAPEATFFNSCCQLEREALPLPDRPLVVGIDGGYVRHWHKKACFEIITGKSMPDEKPAKCFGFVQDYDTKPRRRVFEVLRSQGLQANQSVEFFTDGAPTLRSLTTYLNPESTHILDWFHLTMRLTVLQQYALGLAKVDEPRGKEVAETLTSIKWHLWHGNAERALEKIDDLDMPLEEHGTDKAIVRKYDKLKVLTNYLTEFSTYVRQNTSSIVDYSERYRYGERVSTGFVESTVNQVIAKRFVKQQQMQWSKKGAHLLLQARTKVLNEEWDDCFRLRFPGFRSPAIVAAPMAA
ncbi:MULTISPECIES: ISKra4 family transposase [unclassified Spirosoma]|uniref:ISKra4 family transposase n=1 Tax=unclassified Spirosoma TaxID=2621999 RepID=UPI00095F4321|nr:MULTISPECIES: ISKra4 family transposase [unclassified Spirosoma]MBN8820422.1 ISKra4 family transposase [Spirosoma sp.]OJW70005.1 MAG: hypothetical protein BGO59_03310 [Spirosoma sp. 48-14]